MTCAEMFKSKQFLFLLITIQVIFIILYGFFVRYNETWDDTDTTRKCFYIRNKVLKYFIDNK